MPVLHLIANDEGTDSVRVLTFQTKRSGERV